jgi:hypothetical protein
LADSQPPSTQAAWRQFLLEAEAARHYEHSYSLLMPAGISFSNPLLDRLLPSLLLANAVAILDAHLGDLVACRCGSLPKPYQNSLHGRIEFLADQGVVTDRGGLHTVRERRNALARVPAAAVTWDELAADVATVERTLQQLGAVGPRPRLEYGEKRSELNVIMGLHRYYTREYKCWIAEDGAPAYQVSWTEVIDPAGG